MSTHERRGRYHHGDLRAALLEAGRALLGEEGSSGLSLRAVARRAGVSPMAPYRHFADKEALLAALATEGFERLTNRLSQALGAEGTPVERLREQGIAYVLFAAEEKALFRLMFGGMTKDASRHPALAEAAGAAYAAFVWAVEMCLRDADAETRDDVALTAWSCVHGLSALYLDGQLAARTDDPEALAERVTGVLCGALGG